MQYFKKVGYGSGQSFGLVRLSGNTVERYDGQDIWNANFAGHGTVLMDISGMGDGWASLVEVGVEEVDAIKRMLDQRFEKLGIFSYEKPNSPVDI